MHARPPTAHAPPVRPSYIYKGRYPRRGQSVLARFRSGDDRSAIQRSVTLFPRIPFRDTISGEIKRSPLGREKTTGSVRWLNRDGRFVIPSLFFFSFCEVQLCFAPIQFQLLKSVTRILASSFFFFHEDERFNDLRWNFISLLRRTVNQILRGHRSLLGGFAICQNVPLSIHKDDQPQLSRPRVVNHDTRGKSRKREG